MGTAVERKTHWLRQNAANRLPRRVVCFDCESYQERTSKYAEHTFRLACASFDTLDESAKPTGEPHFFDTDSPGQLWRWIVGQTNDTHRTVAFAHNLSFDLRVSDALSCLPRLGFQCKGIALTPYSCWARFHDGRRSLWLVDSLSFIPVSLERVANALKLDKPSLPREGASRDDWLERCNADVRVTREAILRVLEWVRTDDLGDFRTTGAGQAFAAFRHKFLRPRSLLVHGDSHALSAERRATWSGRAEAWRHGKIGELVYEIDFASAYAHLARELLIPSRLIAQHGPISYPALQKVIEKSAVCADVEIKTEAPCVPSTHNDATVWPVGRFKTTLWDQELELAHEEGAEINVLRYWRYHKSYALRPWAEWILDLLDGNGAGSDPLLRFTIKEWSRALIGRFGLRYSEWESIANLPNSDVLMYQCSDVPQGKTVDYLQIGNDLSEQSGVRESPNSMPMVMGYIMSAARVRLWQAMKGIGFERILYCDTDGLLLDGRGRQSFNRSEVRNMLPPLRHKATYNGADIRAPRNLDLGETRRVNGAPRKSERLTHSIYRGEIWEGLPTALKRHRSDRVLVTDRTFNISDHDPRRIHLPDGKTEPIRIG